MLSQPRIWTMSAALFLTVSCVSIRYVEDGIQEEPSIDVRTIGREVFERAHMLSTDLEAGAEMIPTTHPLSERAREILTALLKASEPDSASTKEGVWEYFNEDDIQLRILVQDAPLALSYPNGKVYVTTGLVDPELPFSAKNDAQLAGVLAHELIHLRDGDVFQQWVSVEAHKRELIKRSISTVTRLLPIVEYIYKPSSTHSDVPFFDELIEYNADYAAMSMMYQLGYEPAEYLAFLRKLLKYRENYKTGNKEPYGWIDKRVRCVEQIFSPTNATMDSVALSAREQYELCAFASVRLTKHGQSKVLAWLKNPHNKEDLRAIGNINQQDAKYMKEFIDRLITSRVHNLIYY